METDRARRALAAILLIGGVALTVAALLLDWLHAASPGFGRRQWAILIVGLLLLLAGVRLTPTLRSRLGRALAVSPGDAVLSLPRILTLALAFAAATALLEGVTLAVSSAFGTMLRLGSHVVWMSALGNVIVLAVLGLALRAIALVWPKAGTPVVVIFVFALVAADTILYRAPIAERLEAWSAWALGIGVAVFAAREMRARLLPPRILPWVTASLLALVVLTTATAFAGGSVRERIAWARLPDSAGDRPNILLIILDTVRAASLGLYGYDRPTTPNLEAFARSGVVFERAIAPSSWTLPSHASLFTGRFPNELSADWRAPLDRTHATLAEVLAQNGYTTAAFSANGAYANAATGIDRGFARFEDFPVSMGEGVRTALMLRRMVTRFGQHRILRDGTAGRKSAADISSAFLGWLSRRPSGRPFFVFLNYFDAHDPYMPAPPFDTLFGPVRAVPRLNWGQQPSAELVAAWRDEYDRSLAYLDHELGLLFDELDARGILDETIIVVTSDHGEHLGEHGYMRHGNTLYMPVVHVPLIARYPAVVPAAVRVPLNVTLRDVPATLLDIAGIDNAPISGNSLVTAWAGVPPVSPLYSEVRTAVRIPVRYPNSAADLHSLFDSGLHYIFSSAGHEELYRFVDDPLEQVNLMSTAELPGDAERFRQVLWTHLGRTAPGIDATASNSDR
jgi:arylsulfatase A-like enzyme